MNLNMRKAYNRLEWDYLKKIMVHLGFHQLWVHMIMEIVKTLSFSILYNVDKLESFNPTKGIRQGDPIPPISSY